MTLLLAVGASHPDVQVDLAHRRALTSGDVAATVQRIREEIALVSAQETWSNRWGEERSIPEYSRVRSGFERLLDDGHADAVVELGGELLDAGGEQVGSSNDDGETGFIHADQRAREQEEPERRILEARLGCPGDHPGGLAGAPEHPAEEADLAPREAGRRSRLIGSIVERRRPQAGGSRVDDVESM